MAKTPDNVLRAIGLSNGNQPLTRRKIFNGFLANGYGPNKANKWIDAYLTARIITRTDLTNEDGAELFDTIYWEVNRNAL